MMGCRLGTLGSVSGVFVGMKVDGIIVLALVVPVCVAAQTTALEDLGWSGDRTIHCGVLVGSLRFHA
jgi:hypothetical protein